LSFKEDWDASHMYHEMKIPRRHKKNGQGSAWVSYIIEEWKEIWQVTVEER